MAIEPGSPCDLVNAKLNHLQAWMSWYGSTAEILFGSGEALISDEDYFAAEDELLAARRRYRDKHGEVPGGPLLW